MEGFAQRIRDTPDRELSVACLTALVLGDRAQNRSSLAEHALLLTIRERAGGFDVEERLHPGLRLLRMLPARPAGA